MNLKEDPVYRSIVLGHLQRAIAGCQYDNLELEYLDKLREEIDEEMEKLVRPEFLTGKRRYLTIELSDDGEKWLESELRFKEGEIFKGTYCFPLQTKYIRFKEISPDEEPCVSDSEELLETSKHSFTTHKNIELRSLIVKLRVYFKPFNEIQIEVHNI